MRRLALTSPEMRGHDIQALQLVLNERLGHYKSRARRLSADGIYGRATAHAVAEVAYALGLLRYDGDPTVIRAIMHPGFRNHAERLRERERARIREHGNRLAVGGDAGRRLVAIAGHYVGVSEHPAGSNWGEPHPASWEREFGFSSGVSWCGCFAGAMIRMAGGHVSSRIAFCPYIEADARSRVNGFDRWVPNHSEGVGPGWLVLFNWAGGSEPEHVGIVTGIHASYVATIEGNTGGVNPSDGGMVAAETRPYGVTVGYARPRGI